MEEGFLDSTRLGMLVNCFRGDDDEEKKEKGGDGTDLVTWPSFSRIVLICDRKSGSSVAGV